MKYKTMQTKTLLTVLIHQEHKIAKQCLIVYLVRCGSVYTWRSLLLLIVLKLISIQETLSLLPNVIVQHTLKSISHPSEPIMFITCHTYVLIQFLDFG